MTNLPAALALRDLVPPITPAEFIESHVVPERHFLSSPNPVVVERLLAIDDFKNFEQLLQRLEEVKLLGPHGFRSAVPGRAALDFYNRGDTLYLNNIERVVPKAADMFAPVAVELGMHPRHINIEIFLGRQGAVSTLHYDHDTNFQLLIKGKKLWRLQRNRHIFNPLSAQHNLVAPEEEVLAERLPFPAVVDDLEEAVELTTTPGTCLFFPIGYWHEVEMFEDSFAVNVVLKPPRWVDAIGAAARRALVSRPLLRAPAFGVLNRNDGPLRQQALRALAVSLEAYAAVLRELGPEDIGFAMVNTSMRWSPRSQGRALEETSTGTRLVCPELAAEPLQIDAALAPLVRRLTRFRGSFGLQDLKTLAPTMSLSVLLLFMNHMKRLAYFEVV